MEPRCIPSLLARRPSFTATGPVSFGNSSRATGGLSGRTRPIVVFIIIELVGGGRHR